MPTLAIHKLGRLLHVHHSSKSLRYDLRFSFALPQIILLWFHLEFLGLLQTYVRQVSTSLFDYPVWLVRDTGVNQHCCPGNSAYMRWIQGLQRSHFHSSTIFLGWLVYFQLFASLTASHQSRNVQKIFFSREYFNCRRFILFYFIFICSPGPLYSR